MTKVVIKEITRFFKNQREMQEYAERVRGKPQYTVVGYGKNSGNSYFVKCRIKEA